MAGNTTPIGGTKAEHVRIAYADKSLQDNSARLHDADNFGE